MFDDERLFSYYYIEKNKKNNKEKGILLNEKANGDNHVGVIAFMPKTFEG